MSCLHPCYFGGIMVIDQKLFLCICCKCVWRNGISCLLSTEVFLFCTSPVNYSKGEEWGKPKTIFSLPIFITVSHCWVFKFQLVTSMCVHICVCMHVHMSVVGGGTLVLGINTFTATTAMLGFCTTWKEKNPFISRFLFHVTNENCHLVGVQVLLVQVSVVNMFLCKK